MLAHDFVFDASQSVFSVQLRPMVRNMAKALLHDVSMLERLYTGPNLEGMSKTMLNVSLWSSGTLIFLLTPSFNG